MLSPFWVKISREYKKLIWFIVEYHENYEFKQSGKFRSKIFSYFIYVSKRFVFFCCIFKVPILFIINWVVAALRKLLHMGNSEVLFLCTLCDLMRYMLTEQWMDFLHFTYLLFMIYWIAAHILYGYSGFYREYSIALWKIFIGALISCTATSKISNSHMRGRIFKSTLCIEYMGKLIHPKRVVRLVVNSLVWPLGATNLTQILVNIEYSQLDLRYFFNLQGWILQYSKTRGLGERGERRRSWFERIVIIKLSKR